MEKWHEQLIFLVLFLVLNGIVLLVCWFSQAITSNNRSSQADSKYASSSGSEQQQQQQQQQRHQQRLHYSSGAANGWRLKRRRYEGSSFSDYQGQCGGSSSSGDSSDRSSEEEDTSRATTQRNRSRAADSRLTYRMSCLLVGSQQDHSRALLQCLEERESQIFRQDLSRISRFHQSGTLVEAAAEPSVSDLMLSDKDQQGLLTEYSRCHALVPVQRFDADYARLENQRCNLNYTQHRP